MPTLEVVNIAVLEGLTQEGVGPAQTTMCSDLRLVQVSWIQATPTPPLPETPSLLPLFLHTVQKSKTSKDKAVF